ncbi:integrase arm-type DNA-binding domain-containing protein [Variovorax sp. S2]|uniref:tyrosine-type recombinase/integrase n=1 Tax=Variovorax sp. S12S4 TaxID=3029170 RepID=UPI00215C421D|nr:integrase arm-type DNA-binding domain-containing protein [Variovorax sp. S12S4]MCR8961189.1 integrase arm-type DNA-binding domain-containing protein [Variovorax sp. S12S4]
MFFDVRAAKLLKPGEHLTVEGCEGLRLVASASKQTWTYRYKSPATGLMKQTSIGPYPKMRASEAAASWETLRAKRVAGIDPKEYQRQQRKPMAPPPIAGVPTVRDVVQDYISQHIEHERQEAGATAARRALEKLLEEEPEFAETSAPGVTRSACFNILEARKATPTAAQKLRSMLGAAWARALDAGRIDEDVPNWWPTLMKGKLKSKGKIVGGEHQGQQRRVLRDDEVGVLLNWLPNMHELGRDVTVIYLWTDARGVEICGMRPEFITKESDGWWWTVPKAMTKNARFPNAVDFRVPLIGRALEVVQRRMKKVGISGLLFEDARGEQYTQHDFSTYIYGLQPYSAKVARREADGLVLPVTNWTPHNLRRTSRTMLASLGCPKEIAEAILGHLPPVIEGTYNSHTYDAERRMWLTRLAKHLERLRQTGAPARP